MKMFYNEKGSGIMKSTVIRGELYMARLEVNGHVQGGVRPVLIVQNNRRKLSRTNGANNSANFTVESEIACTY